VSFTEQPIQYLKSEKFVFCGYNEQLLCQKKPLKQYLFCQGLLKSVIISNNQYVIIYMGQRAQYRLFLFLKKSIRSRAVIQ
jgi:hypothetical protein